MVGFFKKQFTAKKSHKYSLTDFFIDIGLVALCFVLVMIYGYIRGILGYSGVNRDVSIWIGFGLFALLMGFNRPYAGLFLGIVNFNVIMIGISLFELLRNSKDKVDKKVRK